MRRLFVLSLLMLLLAWAGPGLGEADERPGRSPAGPRPPAWVADRVVEAAEADDSSVLKDLARHDAPDPWYVVEILHRRGALDAADAFARAAPRPSTEKLPDYVAFLRTQKADARGHEALQALDFALEQAKWADAVSASEGLGDALKTVTRIRIEYGVGLALARLGKLQEGSARLIKAADAARTLGWLAGAVGAYNMGGTFAYRFSDWRAALATQQGVLAIKRKLGDDHGAARALSNIGHLHEKLAEYPEALLAMNQALVMFRKLASTSGVAMTLGNIGNVHIVTGKYDDAMAAHEEALEIWEKLRNTQGVAQALGNIGVVHEKRGHFPEALEVQQRVLELMEGAADSAGIARALANIGVLHANLGDYPKALATQERVLEVKKALKDRAGEAATLGNIAVVHARMSNFPKAISTQRRALALWKRLQDRAGIATALGNLGSNFKIIGRYPEALRACEQALALMKVLDDRAGVARMLSSLGLIYEELGEFEKAQGLQEEALPLMQALGNHAGEAHVLAALGLLYEERGELGEALRLQKQALALREHMGDRAGAAYTTLTIGLIHRRQRDLPRALRMQQRALEMCEALKSRSLTAYTLGHLGMTYILMKDRDNALKHLDRAVRLARRLRITPTLIRFLGPLARLRLERGDPGRALEMARQALEHLEEILGGLSEQEGALARAQYTDIFGVGALAAAKLEEPAELLTFLESSRAAVLLESIGDRRALSWTSLSPVLRNAEAAAKADEARARHDLERAREAGTMAERRKKARALDASRERQREVAARIQREAKRQAGLFYPKAATLEEVQGQLDEKTALVLYSLCFGEALALVVTGGGERIVELGPVRPIEEACESAEWGDPEADVSSARARLRALLVTPLALPASIRRVLVSPEGPLGYVPFGALTEGRTVTFTPSGTTHALLNGEKNPKGEKIFALGDPQYGAQPDEKVRETHQRGRSLTPLAATRKEAKSIGDVVLLGADATEEKLRDAVASVARWRAVHLACHGLVDPERPTLSSLALSRVPREGAGEQAKEGEEDGFLTCLEVLQMQIHADLVVLSACETAKGRIVHGEGIVGLTRSFMYAGAPRVICSLWKVDDEATQALMLKFYELWHPRAETGPSSGKPLGAAEALRQAQAHIRSQKQWKHPYYWAAWVLWGLPN